MLWMWALELEKRCSERILRGSKSYVGSSKVAGGCMIAGSIMGSMMKTDLKDSLKKINWKLFVALLVMGLCPTVYTTFRTFLLGQLPGEWSYSILGCQQLYLGALTEPLVDSFQAKDIAVRENFVSLLYWLGVTTIVGDDMGTPVFGIPNGAFRQMSAQLFTQAYSEACGIDQRLPAVNAGLRSFAAAGTWDKLFEPLFDVVRQNFAARDAKEGETAVASAVSAILISAGGPYFITREREANGGYYDLALAPRFDVAPKIAHAALIELKYVKAGDPAPTPAQLAKFKADAADQLTRYAADRSLATAWSLTTSRTGCQPVQGCDVNVLAARCDSLRKQP